MLRQGDWRLSAGAGQGGLARAHALGLAIAGANRNDFQVVRETLTCLPVVRPQSPEERPQGLCLDAGYDYDEVRDLLREFGFTAHIQSRGEEAQAIKREAGFKAALKKKISDGFKTRNIRPVTVSD